MGFKEVERNAGNVLNQKVHSFTDLQNDKYDLLINCSGLGSRQLCNDNKIVPIRGQVYKVHAPWIKMAFYADDDTYVIPRFHSVSLETCSNFDNYSME